MVSFKYFKKSKKPVDAGQITQIDKSTAFAELKRITGLDPVAIGTLLSYKSVETPTHTYYAEKINISGPENKKK
jgi:hypothetical protein